MKILIVAAGSHGDVIPFVAIGRELQRRGHAPHLFASGAFAGLAVMAGLPFTDVLSVDEYRRRLANPDATDPRKGVRLLAQAMSSSQRRVRALLEAACEPGRTLVVGSSLAWAARTRRETRRCA